MKPLIVGECNPYGGTDEFALYPAPDGCSGHRLCCLILGMSRHDYLDAFERANLCHGKWSMPLARKRARELFAHPAPLILLGAKVARAFEFVPFQALMIGDGGKTLVLPHPSGLCRLWNEPGMIDRTREAVLSLCPELAGLIGRAKGTVIQ